MPFNFNAPSFFGKLGPQSAGFNPNNAIAGFQRANAISGAVPNLFTTIQATQKNQQDRRVKEAAIAQALAGLVKTQQEVQQSPMDAALKQKQYELDVRKADISEAKDSPEAQLKQLAMYAAATGNGELLGRITDMIAGNAPQIQETASGGGIPDVLGLGSGSSGATTGSGGANIKLSNGKLSVGTGGGGSSLGAVDKANLGVIVGQKKEELKAKASVNQDVRGMRRLLQRYGASLDELKKYDPNIGAKGTGATISRAMASVGNKLGEFPRTKAFEKERLPLANAMAKLVEGGKITDGDRKIYADSMVSALENPSETNVIMASNRIIDMFDKGGDVKKLLDELKTSNIGILNEIVDMAVANEPKIALQMMGLNPEDYEAA